MSEEPPGETYRPPSYQAGIWLVLGAAVVLTLGLFSIRLAQNPESSRAYESRVLPPEPAPVLLPAPEMDDEYWPCSDCHEGEPTNPEVREFEDEHDEMEFAHGDLWCLHCHDTDDRDKLKLANSAPVDFDESWKLCTQCHSQKLGEWKAGVHGKRTGHWWGPKDYRTCVACHSPHSPPFKPLTPKPPPRSPEQITLQHTAKRDGAPDAAPSDSAQEGDSHED